MTTTKTEFELLIENLTMEDILYENKNMLLQDILSNLPKEVVNIIDTLSNEVIPPHFSKLLEGSSIDKLCDIYKIFGRFLTNMKCSSNPLELRKAKIISCIERELNKIDNPTTLVDKIIKNHFTKKTKNIDWVNEFVVGEEVLLFTGSYKKGIIKKINTKSVSVSMYAYDTIDDNNAWVNQTVGKTRLIWKPEITGSKVVYHHKNLKKRGEVNGAFDRYFLEGERSVDYGN